MISFCLEMNNCFSFHGTCHACYLHGFVFFVSGACFLLCRFFSLVVWKSARNLKEASCCVQEPQEAKKSRCEDNTAPEDSTEAGGDALGSLLGYGDDDE